MDDLSAMKWQCLSCVINTPIPQKESIELTYWKLIHLGESKIIVTKMRVQYKGNLHGDNKTHPLLGNIYGMKLQNLRSKPY